MSPEAASGAQELAELALLAAGEAEDMLAGMTPETDALGALDRAVRESGEGPLREAIRVIGIGICGFRAEPETQSVLLQSVCKGSRAARDLLAARELCHAIHDVLMIGPDSIRPEVICARGRRSRSRFNPHPARDRMAGGPPRKPRQTPV